MNWIIAGILIAEFCYSLYQQSKIKAPYVRPGDVQGPTATEGIPIPAVFGTREVTTPNVCWYGDLKATQNGTRIDYTGGLQMAICHGQIDSMNSIIVAGKVYHVSGSDLSSPENFSAISGSGLGDVPNAAPLDYDAIWGGIDVDTGAVNVSGVDTGTLSGIGGDGASYLAQKLGMPSGPRYHGVASVVFKGGHLGSSPYIKPWSFVVQRIHTRLGGTTAQWYDAKAAITNGARSRTDVWKYKVQSGQDTEDYSGTSFDDSAWSQGAGGIGNAPVGILVGQSKYHNWPDYNIPVTNTQLSSDGILIKGAWPNGGVELSTKLWLRYNLGQMPIFPINVKCWHDDRGKLWFNGTEITLTPDPTLLTVNPPHYSSTAVIPSDLIRTDGTNVVAYCVTNGLDTTVHNSTWYNNHYYYDEFIYAGLQVGVESETPANVVDMNPAHIVREAITDPYWGMGYPEALVDDSSFTAAADTLYNEGLGGSFTWTQQQTIEDFLNDIMRHITGVLYVDRATGLFTLKLIRNDYTYGDLPVLDESSISKIESATRKQPGELVNAVTVTYSASVLGGDQGSVTIYEDGLIQVQGGIVSSKIDYPAITSQANAAKLALRDLRMLSTPLLSCTIYAGRQAAAFTIGQPFVLTWPDLGINGLVMRATSIDLGDGITNQVKVACVEDVFFYPSEALTAPNIPTTAQIPPFTAVSTDDYYTTLALDQRNHGSVEFLFGNDTSHSLNSPFEDSAGFPGWTEDPPGVMTCNSAGPINSALLDGIDPFAGYGGGYYYAGWLIGLTVLVAKTGTGYAEQEKTGLYVIDDVGGYYDDVGAFVASNARMHRAPGYDQSIGFVQDMTFLVRSGTSYGGHFFQLATADVLLGSTPMDWTDLGTSFVFSDSYELLTLSQLAATSTSPDSSLQVYGTYPSGTIPLTAGFETLVGTPGATSIPAGPWTVLPVFATVTGGDTGATTTLGFQAYRETGSSSILIFEVQTGALAPGPQRVSALSYSSPQISISTTDRIRLQPTLHTNSTTPVTLSISFNSTDAIKLSIPTPTNGAGALPPDRASDIMGDAFISGDLIVVPSPYTSAYLQTVPSGTTTIHGIDASGIGDGQELIIAINCDSTHKIQFVPGVNSGGTQPAFVIGTVGGVQQTQTCSTYAVYKFKLLKRNNTWELSSKNG